MAERQSPASVERAREATRRQWAVLPQEERDRRIADLQAKIPHNKTPSRAEVRVGEILTRLNIGHRWHVRVGRYVLDYEPQANPPIDLEVDGEYWHSVRAPHRRVPAPEHDAARDAYMAEHGYRVLRIPEQATDAEIEAMLREALA